ncbi:MAG: methyltransferase domain-containing protein [Bacteroidota bacterium]
MRSFRTRSSATEMMDDVSIVDERLIGALDNIKASNRWLGACQSITRPLARWHRHTQRDSVSVLDIGTGRADLPADLVRWGQQHGLKVEVTAIDNNDVTIDYAAGQLDQELPTDLRSQIHLAVVDALHLPYDDDAFDIVLAAQFLHHFEDDTIVGLLADMQRIAADGILVSDLHRHRLAYAGIWTIGHVLPVSPMFRMDGPISVRKGFKRADMEHYAEAAHLPNATIRWQWAFRWMLTTLPV